MDDEGADAGGPLVRFLDEWRLLRPDLEPVGFAIIMHIRHLHLLVGQVLDELASEFDINDSDIRLMMAIKRDQCGQPVRPSELSQRLNLTRATITYRVDRLLDVGLAERMADPSDRRALFVRLTDKGEQVLAEIMGRFSAATDKRLSRVDALPGGRKALQQKLQVLTAEFDRLGPKRS